MDIIVPKSEIKLILLSANFEIYSKLTYLWLKYNVIPIGSELGIKRIIGINVILTYES